MKQFINAGSASGSVGAFFVLLALFPASAVAQTVVTQTQSYPQGQVYSQVQASPQVQSYPQIQTYPQLTAPPQTVVKSSVASSAPKNYSGLGD